MASCSPAVSPAARFIHTRTLVSIEGRLIGVMFYRHKAPCFQKLRIIQKSSNFKENNAILVKQDDEDVGHIDKVTAKPISVMLSKLNVTINWLVNKTTT